MANLKLYCLLIYVGISVTAYSAQLPVYNIEHAEPSGFLSADYFEYLIDESGKLTIEEIIRNSKTLPFVPLGKGLPYSKDVFWCHWRLQNQISDPSIVKDWYMDIGKGDYIDVYLVDQSGKIVDHQMTGEFVPLSQKSVQGRSFKERVLVSLPHNDLLDVYFRLHRINGFPPQLKVQFHQRDYNERKFNLEKLPYRWLFFGMLLTIMVASFFIYVVVRDKAFLYYGIFLFGTITFLADSFFYFLGDLPFFREHPKAVMWMVYLFMTIMNIGYLAFAREYVNAKQRLPRWDKMAKGLIWGNALLLPIAWTIYGITNDEYFTDQIVIPIIFITYLLVAFLIFPILKYGEKTMVEYMIITAICIFIIAIIVNSVNILRGANILPGWTQILMTAEVIAFFIGLAYRFYYLQQEQHEARRVKDLSNLKSKLYQNVTHEFRTPLTVIKGVMDQFESDPNIAEHPKVSKGIATINRNSDNLLTLVDKLLEMARLESGNINLNYKCADIILYLRYLTESFDSMAESKDVHLQFLTNLESLEMDFDAEKVRQVFYNLISNAFKFTPKTGKIIVIVEQEEVNHINYLKTTVKDSGVGISADDLPHIFERFYQANTQLKEQGVGTGIGLALTKDLIQLMDGKINAQSTPGTGTSIQFYLPIRKTAERIEVTPLENSPKDFIEANPIETAPILGNKPTLLLVEDNRDLVEYIKSIVENEYNVLIALNGAKGIDMAQEYLPDIIISDVMMPEKDGYELCHTVKNDMLTSHVPIILLTAKVSHEDRMQGFRQGADAYLAKPFNREELLVRMKNIVSSRKKLIDRFNTTESFDILSEPELSEKDKEFLDKLTSFIQEHIGDEDLDVARMQRATRMSRPQLHRKLKALTGMSASQFKKSIRMKVAKKLLNDNKLNVSEVAYEVGYKYPSHFSNDFKAFFGTSPGQI